MLHVIVPVYNDRQSLCVLLDEIENVLVARGAVRIVIVEDGSLVEPVEAADIEGRPFAVDLLRLRRNVGHQRAIAIGLAHTVEQADLDRVVVMDSDGEDQPRDLLRLLDALDEQGRDVIVARRGRRSEGALFKTMYVIYQWFFRLLTGQVITFGNFSALSSLAAKRLVQMEELWMHFPATLLQSGLRLGEVEVDRGTRYHGKSQMNLLSLVTHGLRSVAVFTESVLARLLLFCAAAAVPCLILIGIAFTIKLIGLATPGWFTTAVGVLLILLAQIGTVALISVLLALQVRSGAALTLSRIAAGYVASRDRASPTD